jgi:hypothetical protein
MFLKVSPRRSPTMILIEKDENPTSLACFHSTFLMLIVPIFLSSSLMTKKLRKNDPTLAGM